MSENKNDKKINENDSKKKNGMKSLLKKDIIIL